MVAGLTEASLLKGLLSGAIGLVVTVIGSDPIMAVPRLTMGSEFLRGDVEGHGGAKVNYPIIADHDLGVAKKYDMLEEDAGDTSQGRTAATNQTVRTVFIIGPDKLIKAMLIYPMASGRNFDEVLRLLDSVQLTAKYKVATPVNWKNGEDCIIVPSVSDEEARTQFPGGWTSDLPYLRRVPHPGRDQEQEKVLVQSE
jgi:hypothetical protein